MFLAILFLISFILSFIGTFIIRNIAKKLKLFDIPHGIKAHKEPIPHLGGISIFFAFLISISFIVLKKHEYISNESLGIILSGTIIMFLGLIDDIKELSYQVKFLGQIIATIILILFDIKIKFIVNPLISISLTIFWMVGITNAFNIIDIMDGLSGGISIIASITFFLIALQTDKFFVVILSIVLMGSVLGFLRFNIPKASIFMGNCGSLFVGFILGAIAIAESYTTKNNFALFVPILILGIPIYDTFLVMFLRVIQKKNIFKGSNDHLAIRLNLIFKDRTKVVLILYLISIILSVFAYFITLSNSIFAIIIYSTVTIISLFFGYKLSKISVK